MKAVIKLELLKKAFTLIDAWVEETPISFTETGFEVRQLDSSATGIIIAKIPKGSFQEYEGIAENVGIKLADIMPILKKCKDDKELIELNIDQRVCLKLKSKEYAFDIFEIAEGSIANDKTEIVNRTQSQVTLHPSVFIDVKRLEFVNAINDMQILVTDDKRDGTGITLKVIGNEFSLVYSTERKSGKTKCNTEKIVTQKDCEVRFDINLLSKMAEVNVCEDIKIGIAKLEPISIEYLMEGMSAQFILAPRVEQN